MSEVTMALCPHDLTDREVAVQCDGYCPLCMIHELAALRAKLVAAREWMLHREDCQVHRDAMLVKRDDAGRRICDCGLRAFLEETK